MADPKKTQKNSRSRRTRSKLSKVANGRPRLSVFRSSKNISAQIIDDTEGKTVLSVSSLDKDRRGKASGKEAAAVVGKEIAERAIKAGVKDVVFDRGSYMYHGRIKALAEAAREAGLKF